jgi:predicted nucleotidyltransferase
MIRYSKLPDNIVSLLPEAGAYLQSREDVLFAYLFGGLAKGNPRPLSDIDIAVYLSKETGLMGRKIEILGDLTNLLKTDEIDLVLLNSAPVTLKMKILENKKVIADKNSFLRHRYESMVMREYFDFSILERAILERRFLRG